MAKFTASRQIIGWERGGDQPADEFDRAIFEDSSAAYSDGWTGTLAPSLRCDYCGTEVWGSDAPSLDSAKEAHRENCAALKIAST